MDTKSGQSEDKGKMKKEKIHKVQCHLMNLRNDHIKKQVVGTLKMPSSLPSPYNQEGISPPVRLDLHCSNKDSKHCLNIMRESTSSNILHARLVMEGKTNYLAWVEPYDGNLLDYLKSTTLGIPEYPDVETVIVLPTFILKSVVSQIIHGIEQLRVSGQYHGNFSFENTYYSMESAEVRVKLTKFEKKGANFHRSIAEDWWSVADELEKICDHVDKLNEGRTNIRPHLDCCQLYGLVNLLRNISASNIQSAKEAIFRQPFFWGKMERTEFFVYAVPKALKRNDFLSKLEKAEFIDLPWGVDAFDGLLSEMNKDRTEKGKKEYDQTSKRGFVHFISGIYTHEFELEDVQDVDASVQIRHPTLCYELYSLMPHANTVSTYSN